MNCLTICGVVGVFGGWGQHLIQIASRLENLYIRPIRYWDYYGEIPDWLDMMVRYDIPQCPELILYTAHQEPTRGRRTMYYTMHETDRMHAFGVSNLNMADVVVVPNQWNKKSFEASGIRTPIKVVPLGVDPDVFRPTPMKMNGPTIFGCAGRPQHGVRRKGVNMVIEAFEKAFTKDDDVLLWLKCLPDEDAWVVPENSHIDVTRKYLTNPELKKWFDGLTCFVSASAGEGWGLMQHQAMTCGRPVIASIYGGLAEFMTSDNSYACDFDIVPATEKYQGCGNWAAPRLEHLIDLMRYVHQSRDEAARRGRQSAKDVKHLTWQNSCDHLFNVMREFKFL